MGAKAIVGLALCCAAEVVSAADAVSSRFALDLHYESSGEKFPGEEGAEVFGLSSRWTAQTAIWKVDSDGDGLPDEWEKLYGLDSTRRNANEDADGDGWTNIAEYNAGTNPTVADNLAAMSSVSLAHTVDTGGRFAGGGGGGSADEIWALSLLFAVDTVGREPDSDGDGLPDWYERLYGLNCTVADAHLDPDGDGRTNLQEYNTGTNPMIADDWVKASAVTDNPFVTDTRVYYTGGNPDFDEAFAVIRVSDGFICDTGGLYYDWDGDGIPNWWEKRFARDGSKTGLVAQDDDDRDGLDNYGEFVAYTDPTDAKSKFVLGFASTSVKPLLKTSGKLMLSAAKTVPALRGGAAFALSWQSAKGRTYSIWRTDDLSKGWGLSPVAEIDGTGEVLEYQVDFANANAGFFKVSVRLSDDY